MLRWLKHNHLLLITTLMFLGSTALILYWLDISIYQPKKKSIIIDQNLYSNLNSNDTTTITKMAGSLIYYTPRDPENENQVKKYNEVKAQVAQTYHAIIASDDNLFYNIIVQNEKLEIIYKFGEQELQEMKKTAGEEYLLKTQRFNTYKNCLFLRGFEGVSGGYIEDGNGNKLGRTRIYYTTPPSEESIELLTEKFRWISLGIVTGIGLIYFYLVWFLFLPVKRVASRVDEVQQRNPRILPRPKSLLERQYNTLARDSLMTAISTSHAQLLSQSRLPDLQEMFSQIDRLIMRHLLLESIAFFSVELSARKAPVNFQQVTPPESELDFIVQYKIDRKRREQIVEECLKSASSGDNKSFRAFFVPGRSNIIAGLIRMHRGQRYFELALCCLPRRISGEMRNWLLESLAQICQNIHGGLRVLEAQKNLIFTEKRQANINLSRQLGHDLTNVIATSKLDLTTTRMFLKTPEMQSLESPRFMMFKKSIEHLENNTRFLQEIVNIYRAFSYIKHPRYEEVQLNELLENICQIFRLSTSQRFTINTRFDSGMPRCNLEVRLIKLAVFNILNNAVEALKRKEDQQSEEAITVETRHKTETKEAAVLISDTGPGIRDAAGNLLQPDDLENIFELGVTTKAEDTPGEGLGLNWVKTIVMDFHKGSIQAHNLDRGGAMLQITLSTQLPAGDYPQREAATK
ncbi:hypothetical protein JXA32_03195 [Candidatus Sumerlaeota bacterium]|nr:hypothetical protein [Candidatus Sumerlaeota bacterium]